MFVCHRRKPKGNKSRVSCFSYREFICAIEHHICVCYKSIYNSEFAVFWASNLLALKSSGMKYCKLVCFRVIRRKENKTLTLKKSLISSYSRNSYNLSSICSREGTISPRIFRKASGQFLQRN